MNKKIVAFVCVCCMAVSAMAVEIDTAKFRTDWSRLVDRVACEYVRAYIISLENNAEMGPRAKIFKTEVAPKLRNKGNYITLNALSDVMVQSDWKHTGEVLLTPLADRKLLVPADQTLEHLLDLSCYTPTMQACLRSASTQLYSIIASEYPYTPQSKAEQPSDTEQPTTDTAAITPTIVAPQPAQTTSNTVWFVILGLLVVAEGILLFRQTSPKRLITMVKESHWMSKTYVRKDDDDISELHAKVIQLTRRIEELELQQNRLSTTKASAESAPTVSSETHRPLHESGITPDTPSNPDETRQHI